MKQPVKRELFKVQKSVFASSKPRILVYNKDRSALFEGDATEELLTLMSGVYKAFVWGHMNRKKVIVLDMNTGKQDDPGW